MKMIEINNLGKKYSILHEHQNPYASLKEILSCKAKRFIDKIAGKGSPDFSEQTVEEFWALQNLSLAVEEGDKVALLGRNGAGKSTFLKLLSRITEPTTGQIIIRGKVSSLLEVGTGFHPELTGRENIFLNGAIIGISYKEMKRKFDEIVAFADVEKFLDTPIKRYSSGMFMRLGFAIAVHLDSEVLIVDEVLAVGDAQFQEKCLKKMNEMGAQGRTIFYVSHNINSVLALCNKGIFLEKGRLKAFEPIEDCISQYVQSGPIAGLIWEGNAGNESIRFFKASLQASSNDVSFFYHGEKTLLAIQFEVMNPHQDLILGFSVLNVRQQTIARTRLCDHGQHHELMTKPGCHEVCFEMDLGLFHPGEYQIKLECSQHRKKILEDEILITFAVYEESKIAKHEFGLEKDGISLGNRWVMPNNISIPRK